MTVGLTLIGVALAIALIGGLMHLLGVFAIKSPPTQDGYKDMEVTGGGCLMVVVAWGFYALAGVVAVVGGIVVVCNL